MKLFQRLSIVGKYKKAITFFNKGMYLESIALFNQIIQCNPSNKRLHYHLAFHYCTQAHYCLGMLFFATGNYPDAVSAFEKAIAMNPDRVEIYEYLGVCYNNVGKYDQALDAFAHVATMDPSHYPTRLKLAVAFRNLGLWERARATCQEVVQSYPNYADAHYFLGLIFLGMNDPQPAVHAFEKALSINSGFWNARIKLGISQAFLGQTDKAVAEISSVVKQFPDYIDLQYLLGVIYSSRKDIDTAVHCFQKILSQKPEYPEARIKLSILLWEKGQYAQARALIKKGTIVSKNDRALTTVLKHYDKLLGTVAEKKLNLPVENVKDDEIIKKALADISKNISIVPNYSEMLTVTSQLPDENPRLLFDIIEVVKESVDRHRAYPDYHCSLGALYFKVRNYGDAATAFRKAIEINPDYINAHLLLFFCLKADKEYRSAVDAAAYLSEKNVPYPDFYCALGEIFLKLDELENAKASLARALSINPNYLKAQVLMDKLC